jgi:predicted RNA binding protein YcfA (HicA-like mRNA interferase family)
MNGSEVVRKLKSEGWRLVRIRGSHHLMEKNGKVIPVPVHGPKEVGKGLLAEIARQTGVKFK